MRVLNLIGAAVVAIASLTTFSATGVLAMSGKAGSGVGSVSATGQDETLQLVTIFNVGNSELVDVFFSESGLELFDEDLFEDQFQLAGGDWTMVMPRVDYRYCMYDAKFVFADGSKQFLWEFNLCETVDITISEYGIEDMTSVD